jgi:hypothetical protein
MPYRSDCAGWLETVFRRGFPDSVKLSLPYPEHEEHYLRSWTRVAPLGNVSLISSNTEEWIDGPHLAGLQSITLADYNPAGFLESLGSPHLKSLQELILRVPCFDDEQVNARYAGEFELMLDHPRLNQLKRLSIPLWSDRAAEVVAGAERLAGLIALEVELQPAAIDDDAYYGSADLAVASQRIAMLARSPYLARLRELTVVGGIDDSCIDAAIRNPTWTGLRKLDFRVWFWPDRRSLLEAPDDLPELEELRLSGVSYSVAQVSAFARSPLLKRLRHFALRGGPNLSVDFDIARAVDPARIETFAIGAPETSPRVRAMLQDHFGDRFRILG